MTFSMPASSASAPPFVSNASPKRILIVGAGASGLVTLRNLTHGDAPFEQVSLYERRSDLGGVWNLEQQTVNFEASFPQGTSQDQWPLEPSSSSFASSSHASRPLWPSPSYPQLRGNVLPRFLSFSMTEFPSPANDEIFPTLAETHDYLTDFSKTLRDKIKFNIEVVGIYELPPCPSDNSGTAGGWRVLVKDWNLQGEERTEFWDSIILASGWTEREFYPKANGFCKAKAMGKIHHAKWYRHPEIYKGKRVIVVGNGNSANDIAAHVASLQPLSPSGKEGRPQLVYRSIKSEASPLFVSLEDERIKDVAEIKEYHCDEVEAKLIVELISGAILENIDFVIFGTGYQIGDYPFVKLLNRTPDPKEIEKYKLRTGQSQEVEDDWRPPLESTGLYSPVVATQDFPNRIQDLYFQCLHARNPTLGFVGLVISSTPFVSSDLISWFIRSVYDSSLQLPLDFGSRVIYEQKRVQLLEKRKAESKSLLDELKKEWQKQEHNASFENARKLRRATAAPKALPFSTHFHILGGGEVNDEIDFAKHLRDLVTGTQQKKWLDRFLDPWNDEREKVRMQMYTLKYQSLLKRREIELERVGNGVI